jgi:hypothetical protein
VNNTYITNVYQNNVTNIHYVNNTTGAVTAVPQNVFTSGERVGGHAVHMPDAVLARASITAAPPAIVPIHQSVLGPNAGRTVARPPAELVSRPVVARTPPPRAPVPFDRQVAAIQQNGGRPLARADLARLQPATPVAPVRMIAAGGAAVGAGALAHGASSVRPSTPATPTRPAASTPPASAGGQAPNFADRERVLQNSRVPPTPHDSNRPPAATRGDSSTTTPISPSQPPAPQLRTDRPQSAPQPVPPTQQHTFSSDDPTHAYSRPPAAPVNRPPPAAAAPVNPSPRPPPPQYQEQRYRPPAPAAAPPPAPVREAPSPPPAYRAPAPAAAPPPAPVREAPSPPPANRPPEHPAAPPRPQEAKPESRDSGPHGDRTSRDRAER